MYNILSDYYPRSVSFNCSRIIFLAFWFPVSFKYIYTLYNVYKSIWVYCKYHDVTSIYCLTESVYFHLSTNKIRWSNNSQERSRCHHAYMTALHPPLQKNTIQVNITSFGKIQHNLNNKSHTINRKKQTNQ